MKGKLTLLSIALLLLPCFGCSGGGGETAQPIGETAVSKQGEDQMKANGGKPMARGGATDPNQ